MEIDKQQQSNSLQNALTGLNLQIGSDESNGNDAQHTELLVGAATAVVSFVFVNREPSLFNLLIQMLSTNKFTPIPFGRSNSFSSIPFQGSPNPSNRLTQSQQPTVQQQPSPPPPQQSDKKGSQMFSVLQDAINAVSQQYNTNFYIHILDGVKNNQSSPDSSTNTPTTPRSTSSSTTTNNTNPSSTSTQNNQLLSGCLAFINHMMSSAPSQFDFERYRQLLSAQGINDAIKKFVKNVDPNVRSELLHYQKHKLTNIKLGKQIIDSQPIEHLANRLCKISFPGQAFDDNSSTEKLIQLGFNTLDPNTELNNTGILGLRNLIYFAARYSRIYQEILNVQLHRDREGAYYSFAQVGMSLTNVIYEIYIDDETIYEIIFDQDDWFEELFSISFELFDEIWEREAKKPEDFLIVLHKTRNILSRIKWTNPDSIHTFQVTLGGVLDEIFTKPEHPDMEEARPSVGLSDSILGLPSNNHYNSTYRFQKFLNERLDKIRTVGRKDSSGSNHSVVASFDDDQSSNHSATAPDSPTTSGRPTHLRHHIKSISFKKLFDFNKSSDSNGNGGGNIGVLDSAETFNLEDEEKERERLEKAARKAAKKREAEQLAAMATSKVEDDGNGGNGGSGSQIGFGSLKSSGTAIYKTVKKAMHSLEKKGQTIKKRVKRKGKMTPEEKKEKREKKKSMKLEKQQQQQLQQQQSVQQQQQEIIQVPFQPNLDLDFSQGDSSSSDYEEDDESDSETEGDDTSRDGDEEVIDSEPSTPSSNIIVSINNDTKSNGGGGGEMMITIDSMNNSTGISMKSTVTASPSTDSLSSASNLQLKLQQSKIEKEKELIQLEKEKEKESSTNTTDTPIVVQQEPVAKIQIQTAGSPIKASTSTGDISGMVLGPSGNRKSIYGVDSFTKGPFGTIERRKSPSSPIVKSTSIKHLVNFFETKHEGPPSPTIQRQKSFRSDRSDLPIQQHQQTN